MWEFFYWRGFFVLPREAFFLETFLASIGVYWMDCWDFFHFHEEKEQKRELNVRRFEKKPEENLTIINNIDFFSLIFKYNSFFFYTVNQQIYGRRTNSRKVILFFQSGTGRTFVLISRTILLLLNHLSTFSQQFWLVFSSLDYVLQHKFWG